MILSVDTGNKQIKTEHAVLNANIREIVENSTANCEEDVALEYNGKFYAPSNKRMRYLREKFVDDRYYLLTLIGIAKELQWLEAKGVYKHTHSTLSIHLLVGLPPKHLASQYQKYQAYFFRNGEVIDFKYDNISYRVQIKDVHVYAQAYSAAITVSKHLGFASLPKVLVIDLGGGTDDYVLIRYGELDREFKGTLENGVMLEFSNIKTKIIDLYDGLLLDDKDIEDILLGKRTMVSTQVVKTIKELAVRYVVEYLGQFRELEFDFRTSLTLFVGGGTLLLQNIIEDAWKYYGGQYYILPDICANAKGFRKQYISQNPY